MRALFDRVVWFRFEQATENVQKHSDFWCEGELGRFFETGSLENKQLPQSAAAW